MKIQDVTAVDLNDLRLGNIVEYLHPKTKKDAGRFGTGQFIEITPKGNIKVENSIGEVIEITPDMVRWDRTAYYNTH